jgi:broad specificity phosphatase PhoE
VFELVQSFLSDLKNLHSYNSVLLITHGGTTKILRRILDKNEDGSNKNIEYKNPKNGEIIQREF